MFSVIFASLGSFIEEISSSIIKFETDHKKESIYTAGFINALFGIVILVIIAFWRKEFIFSFTSLPFFIPRAILEVLQAHITMKAIMSADRSTYAFIRNLTIPLLLVIDYILGFSVNYTQWFGIVIIFAILGIILFFRIANLKGVGYPLFTAVNAVATISLFKYDIIHFNSVEAEQITVIAILLCYFIFMAKFVARENPFSFLGCRIFLGQGFTHGTATVLETFAISLGNPGIAIAAKRASAVLAGVISGHEYFKERKLFAKILVSLGLVVGLALLTR